jgi:hypothetical protein
MKFFIFPLAVIFSALTGCGHKADSEPKTLTPPSTVVSKGAESMPVVAATIEKQDKVQETTAQVKKSVNAASSVTAPSAVKPTIAKSQAVKESTDQMLADTVDHAREVTKSQVSSSRQHAQKAEDEMSDMLKNK